MNIHGRPLKFPTPAFLQKKIDQYFATTPEREITICGLALFLDTTRETLCDYNEKNVYSDIVKKAKLRVQHEYEKDLRKQGRSGDIFALKNFGWTDRQEIQYSGEITIMPKIQLGEKEIEMQIGKVEDMTQNSEKVKGNHSDV